MIVTVAQQKGGVGKTTTALNLAHELGLAGRRVLAVDLDPQFAMTRQLGALRGDGPTLVEVLSGRAPASAALVETHGVTILPAHRDLASVELALVGELGRERFLAEALGDLDGFDDAVIDTPPNLGLLTVNGLLPADLVVAPVSAEDEGSAQGLAELRATVARLERLRSGASLPMVALTSKWRSRRVMTDVVERAVSELGIPIRGRIAKRAVLQQAAVHRLPVRLLAPKSDSAATYAALADDLLREVA